MFNLLYITLLNCPIIKQRILKSKPNHVFLKPNWKYSF